MKILGLYITTAKRQAAQDAAAEKLRQDILDHQEKLMLTMEDNFKRHVQNERISTAQVSKLMDQNISLIGKITVLRGKGAVNLN